MIDFTMKKKKKKAQPAPVSSESTDGSSSSVVGSVEPAVSDSNGENQGN